MWWLIIPAVLLLVFCFLLLTPLVIEVNSASGQYQVRWIGIAKVNLVPVEGTLLLRIKILWWKRQIDLLEPRNATTEEKTKKKKVLKRTKSKKPVSLGVVFRKVKAVLRSFKVEHLYLTVDTGDYLWNAWLYPAAIMGSKGKRQLRINFNDEFHWRMKVTNNVFRIAMAYIKS